MKLVSPSFIFDFEDMSREDIENFENALRIDLTY